MPAVPPLIDDILEQAFNQGNLAVVDDLVLVDSPVHMQGWGMPANRLGLKQLIAVLRTAFPDLHCTVEEAIEQEDKTAAMLTLKGTYSGSFLGNMPSGRLVNVQGFIFTRSAGRRITEGWLLIDQMSLLQQIGIVPPPHGKI